MDHADHADHYERFERFLQCLRGGRRASRVDDRCSRLDKQTAIREQRIVGQGVRRCQKDPLMGTALAADGLDKRLIPPCAGCGLGG